MLRILKRQIGFVRIPLRGMHFVYGRTLSLSRLCSSSSSLNLALRICRSLSEHLGTLRLNSLEGSCVLRSLRGLFPLGRLLCLFLRLFEPIRNRALLL